MRYLLISLMCLAGCGIEGINNANPVTRFKTNPQTGQIEFYDSKDNDVEMNGLSVEGKGKLDSLKIRNNASDVRNANVNQLLGMAAEATANWQGAAAETKALGEVLAQVMPFVPQAIAASALGKLKGGTSVTGPGGVGLTQSGNAQLAEYLAKIAGSAIAPASQPQ